MEFPASSIYDLKQPADEKEGDAFAPPEMTVNFMGLTGPMGVLPRHYTETLMERRLQYRDETALAFFDLFNHRLISLFYQAWEKYHFYVPYEQGNRETFTRYLLDLVGMGIKGLQGRLQQDHQGMDDQALVYYSGLLAQHPHSASALAAVISDYFGVEASVKQFRGRWLELRKEDCNRIGQVNNQLGETTILGDRVWDKQSSFRVKLGPLSRSKFNDFLPSGSAFTALHRFIRFFAGPSMDFDVQLILKKEEVAEIELGAAGTDDPQLGWSTWSKSRPLPLNADDAIFPCAE